jgi:hypothetical protein
MAPFSLTSLAPRAGENCVGAEKIQVVYIPPSNCPWTRPATHRGRGVDTTLPLKCRMNDEYEWSLMQLHLVGARGSRVTPGEGRPFTASILFFTRFFPSPFASQSSLDTLFLAGLQVKGVALNLLNNVFLLHLALEAAQSILEGFSLLQSYFSQLDTPPDPSCRTG